MQWIFFSFQKAPETVSSQSFHNDLSLPRPSSSGNNQRPSPPSRYSTAMESQNSIRNSQQQQKQTTPPIRSTISKFRELYLSESADNAGGKKKLSTASHCVPTTRFGCATLPTKLKQTASFNGKLSSRASAPQMNRKCFCVDLCMSR